MPTIILDKMATRLDGSVKAAVMGFLEKLSQDDTLPGLHIEPIVGSADGRVRTGRVNRELRAVLFRMTGAGEPYYLFHGVWPHDQAIAKAKQVTLTINPTNGQAMIRAAVRSSPASSAPGLSPGGLVTSAVPPVAPWLVRRGFTAVDLTDQLGLPADVAAAAMTATSDDELFVVAGQEEGWIADVLLELAVGTPVSDIVAALDLGSGPAASTDSDDGLLSALQTTTGQAQFAFIDGQDELRRVIDAGDFGQWRLFLHPEQRRYVNGSWGGSFRLSGAAGTGKTVVLAHRTRTLARRNPRARIVVTTFTRNLADSLRESLAELDRAVALRAFGSTGPGVMVGGVDALVANVIKHADRQTLDSAMQAVLGSSRTDPRPGAGDKAWAMAIDVAGPALPPQLANEAFFRAEYTAVVLANTITTVDDYLRARRPGRGVALSRERRRAVWDVITAYRTQAQASGTVDFAEAAAVAAAYLKTVGPMVDHVLVDEGQDLSAPQWQFLRALVPAGRDDLFIAVDAHQRIYGQQVVLGRHEIAIVGRSRRLTLNYRTTAQNLRAALATLDGGDYRDENDEPVQITGYRSARTGPEPVFVTVRGRQDESAAVVQHLRAWRDADPDLPLETVGVLVHDRYTRERLVDDLVKHQIPARVVDRERPGPGKVAVMTMHRAKGLEFAKVVLVAHGSWPGYARGQVDDWDPSLQAEADLRERSLLYVAMTRARDELVVIRR